MVALFCPVPQHKPVVQRTGAAWNTDCASTLQLRCCVNLDLKMVRTRAAGRAEEQRFRICESQMDDDLLQYGASANTCCNVTDAFCRLLVAVVHGLQGHCGMFLCLRVTQH
jgi:hypothetical protein